MPGEVKVALPGINAKHGNIVAPLIAGIEEPTTRIETEAARIISSCPLLSDERQLAGVTDGKNSNTVVQPVTGVDKAAIVRDENT